MKLGKIAGGLTGLEARADTVRKEIENLRVAAAQFIVNKEDRIAELEKQTAAAARLLTSLPKVDE